MIKVILVDDHVPFRQRVRQLLEASGQVQVMGEADEGQAAMRLIQQEVPDMVVTDLTMPGWSGLDLIRRLAISHQGLPVLVLSVHHCAAYADQVRRAGGQGYVSKTMAEECLLPAILKLHQGGSHFIVEPTPEPVIRGATAR